MTKPESPCLGCIERVFNCHGKCVHYAEYRKALKKWADTIARAKDEEFITIDKSKLKGVD